MKKYSIKQIIFYVLVFSVILYIAGIFTGININKILNLKVEEDLNKINFFLDSSSVDIKNIILSDYYTNNFNHNKCELLNLQLLNIKKNLPNFWSKLPERLEDYEINNKITDEYIGIKREYFRYSMKLWLFNTNYNNYCNDSTIKSILYFYNSDCLECLNSVKLIEELNNPNILVLPIEGNFGDDTIQLLKELYNITSYPSFLFNYSYYTDVDKLILDLNNNIYKLYI
jgi:hypothetical protein